MALSCPFTEDRLADSFVSVTGRRFPALRIFDVYLFEISADISRLIVCVCMCVCVLVCVCVCVCVREREREREICC